MTATLEQLLVVLTKEEELARLLSVFQSAGFPVTDWEPGGAGRTLAEAIAAALADKSSLVSSVAAGGLLLLAKDLPEPTWTDLLAEQFYDLARARATYTTQLCRVRCDVGFGPITLNTGASIVQANGTGHRYIYQGPPVDVPDGGAGISIVYTAESPGSAYRDEAGTLTTLVTPLPGLSINNPATPFGGLQGPTATRNPANQGSGTITPSGAPTRRRLYVVTVTATGDQPSSGAVRIEYYEDGVPFVVATIAPIPASYLVADDGVTLTFDNGLGAGFIIRDSHTFQTPGSPIISPGVDDETNEALAIRCMGRWPSLSLNIVSEKYRAWVNQVSLENAFGIEKVSIKPSNTIAGQSDILVATAAGAPAGPTIAAIQAYLNARDGITDTAIVTGAINKNVLPTGTVTVPASQMTVAQNAADVAWRKYIEALPIGGDTATGSPGVVRLMEMAQALMDAGAIDLQNLRLNGNPVNLPVNSNEAAVIPAGQDLSAALTWIPV